MKKPILPNLSRNFWVILICALALIWGMTSLVHAQTPEPGLTGQEQIIPTKALIGEKITFELNIESADDAMCNIAAPIPLDVALVIDNSGTMKGNPLDDAQHAAIAFVEELRGRNVDQVAVISFNKSATEHQSLSRNYDQIGQNIASISDTNAGTVIRSGLEAGRQALIAANARAEAETVLVLLSDGETSYVSETRNAAQAVKAAGIDIVGICLGADEDVNCEFMQEIVSAVSVPYYYRSPSSADLKEIYRTLAWELTHAQAATNIHIEHQYAADKISVDENSISDAGQLVGPDKIVWELPALSGEHTFSYQAEILEAGHYNVSMNTDVMYVHCEQGTPQPAEIVLAPLLDVPTPTPTNTPTSTPTPTATPTPTPTPTATPTPTPTPWCPLPTIGGPESKLNWCLLLIPIILLLLLGLLLWLLSRRRSASISYSSRPETRARNTVIPQRKIKRTSSRGGASIQYDKPPPRKPPKSH